MRIQIDPERAFSRDRLGVIAGPCMAEDEGLCLEVARELERIARRLEIPLVFKTSYAKQNRTSRRSSRGPGLEEGLAILGAVRAATGLPLITDVHETTEVQAVARVVQLLQIPAFLCRQSPLLEAAGATGLPVNVKKGQFLAPASMAGAVDKLRGAGCPGVLLTERGSTFGYGDLVVDMRSFAILRQLEALTVFDMTHSLQQPGGPVTGGNRTFAEPLARAALAAGADILFLETHPEPARALSDAATQLPLAEVEGMLTRLTRCKQDLLELDAEPADTPASPAGIIMNRRQWQTPSRSGSLQRRPIRMLFLDVDGVLADGGIHLGEAGELKRFSARDGAASFLSRRANLKLMLITFRHSEAVRRRAEELGVEAAQGVSNKLEVVERVCAEEKLDLEEAAFMGDDLVDLKAMRAVGLAIAPRDAASPALGLADIVTGSPGGQGAVREAVEIIMWLNRVLTERGEAS